MQFFNLRFLTQFMNPLLNRQFLKQDDRFASRPECAGGCYKMSHQYFPCLRRAPGVSSELAGCFVCPATSKVIPQPKAQYNHQSLLLSQPQYSLYHWFPVFFRTVEVATDVEIVFDDSMLLADSGTDVIPAERADDGEV
ncbi:hypothetical protein K469DRAFT_157271 [Zopfia rhizophila CBS 207.26]|uniref:Uncharacterized protein n=1 Tax=Zopfia rhizophila CBS 207.26 TaxID=1314779 RepID=A0A6A6E4A5_9PEZI|nr:hypothetical protein K469DRAFT_157271 [Zopfia rhizophila CBS 207.26]